MQVKDIMTTQVISIREDESLADVARKFADLGISGAPVLDGAGHLSGIISESDILSAFKSVVEGKLGREAARLGKDYLSLMLVVFALKEEQKEVVLRVMRSAKVKDVMTVGVIWTTPTESVESAALLMARHDINRLPVVDREKVAGIVTRADIMRYVASWGQ